MSIGSSNVIPPDVVAEFRNGIYLRFLLDVCCRHWCWVLNLRVKYSSEPANEVPFPSSLRFICRLIVNKEIRSYHSSRV